MSTITLTHPPAIRARHAMAIGLAAILILTSIVLIVIAILTIVLSTTKDTYQSDQIPVVQNSVIPIPVPTPPLADIQTTSSEALTPGAIEASELYVMLVPVPTPPLS